MSKHAYDQTDKNPVSLPLTLSDINIDEARGLTGDELNEAMASVITHAVQQTDNLKKIVISNKPEETNISEPTGTVFNPYRWQNPTDEEIQDILENL